MQTILQQPAFGTQILEAAFADAEGVAARNADGSVLAEWLWDNGAQVAPAWRVHVEACTERAAVRVAVRS